MEAAVHINNLEFRYGKDNVLEKATAAFPANRFSVLLGANGSGKSTLFRLIAGLLKNYSGHIYLHGKESAALTYKYRSTLMGFLPQFHSAVFPYSVEEIMLTGRTAFSRFSVRNSDRQLLEKVLKKLDINHLKHNTFTKLSGGEQQMVMVGRLLMQGPRIILMDEPTNHLDVYYQQYLMHQLKEYSASGHTVIAIMHNPTLAYQYADNIYFMHEKTVSGNNHASVPDTAMLEKIYGTSFLDVRQGDTTTVLPARLS